MKTVVITASAACVVLAMAGVAAGQVSSGDLQRRQREMKAQHERRAAEMKRSHQQRVEEMKRSHEQRVRQMQAQQSRFPSRSPERPREQPASAFDPATAPPPAACLAWYVAAASGANSMEELLKYLPLAEQRSLKESQASYDPRQAAENRQQLRKLNPKLTEASLTRLTNPPYVNALDHHKQIAGKILDVLRVTIDGNKCVIVVSTTGGGTVNDVEYPYGTAKIEMLGEEGFWKLDRYNDSFVVYLHPPQPKE